jgi:hypothetical protein
MVGKLLPLQVPSWFTVVEEATVSVSNLVSIRQFPEALRPRLQVAYAEAREALVATHVEQAVQFTREFARRLPPFEALDLYFRVVAVPHPMEEYIVSRALVDLEVVRLAQSPPKASVLEHLKNFHLEGALETLRQQRQYLETTYQLARLAGARASEAVLATHVENAIRVVDILEETIWVDEAVSHYVHTFRLPLATAHMVFQRARARVVDRYLNGMAAAPAPMPKEANRELRLPESVRIAS